MPAISLSRVNISTLVCALRHDACRAAALRGPAEIAGKVNEGSKQGEVLFSKGMAVYSA